MTKSTLSLVCVLFVALAMSGCGVAGGMLRVHTYVIPAKMTPGWITIEYNNPQCAPLPENSFGRLFVIPESAYLCTSSPPYTEWHRTEFYVIDEKNNRTRIQEDERIFRQGSFTVVQGSITLGPSDCKFSGDEFFYGPKETLTYENPYRQNEVFLHYHPECSESATATMTP